MAGLHLSALRLAQFRSHRSARLVLDARPVAIFGPNGAGKTNLLEAVSLFSPGRGLRRATAQDMLRLPGGPGWKVSGVLHARGQVHEIEIWSEGGQPRQLRIDGKPAAQTVLGRIARVLWLTPAMDRLWIEGAEGRRRFLDRVAMSFEPDHGAATLAFERAMRERNRLLRDQVRDGHWYVALERQMAESGLVIHRNRLAALARLRAAQDAAPSAFPAAHLALGMGEEEMPASVADYREALHAGRRRDMAAGRTLLGPHRADLQAVYAAKGVPAATCSTGEQKALLISLVLANARALAEDLGSPPLLLLDEVAAHLDAARRATLYDELGALGAQAWLTGTGAELFAELGARAQHVEITGAGAICQPGVAAETGEGGR